MLNDDETEITSSAAPGASQTAEVPTLSDFMAAVVPWPTESEPGFINLHYKRTPNAKYPNAGFIPGFPFGNATDLVNRSAWMLTKKRDFMDQWFCLSKQREKALSKGGKDIAKRNSVGATHLKAIWVDVDYGKKDKKTGVPIGYQSYREALLAMVDFIARLGLPAPSAVVKSGGGAHVYWISKTSMERNEWEAYARGLKAQLIAHGVQCDTMVTGDAARLLRMPGSLNYKYDPPVEVVFDTHFPLVQYDFGNTPSLVDLQKAGGPVLAPQGAPAGPHSVFAEGMSSAFRVEPAKAFQGLNPTVEKLSAGIEKPDHLVPATPIFKQCGMYREALMTGGAHQSQTIWMLSVLGTTFMENGNVIAHHISKGHAGYTEADTQALYDRKKSERASAGLGYPSCKAFADAGSPSCATCKLFKKIKSPLNIRPVVTATLTGTSSQSGSSDRGMGSAGDTTVNYVPGNEVACRTALDNVVAADQSTFTSGDVLIILRVPDQEKQGLERWSGDLPGTTLALPADVIERAERLTWMSSTGGRGDTRLKRRKPPRDFCTDYITQRRGRYAARPLVGIARVPYIRDDGKITSKPGYDSETGIYVDRAPKLIVLDLPTFDDARAALRRVMEPYEHYAFEDPVNGPLQVLAANLTALQRPYMKTAPMFVVNGVQAGTGKGQLCRAIGHLALGTTPPFMSWGHDDDEFKKRFDTMLLASPAMLVMDNCNGRTLRGDTLEMILSEGEATIRQFNKLEATTVRSRTFLMANGNNIQISGDMSRRGIKINILPRSASPESDVFPFTPEDYVIKHRDALLSHYYTIMRAFRHASMPSSGLPAIGSFSEWERKVRDLIFWLTGHDLSSDFKKNKLDDPEQQEDAAVLTALRDFFGERWFKASEADAAVRRAADRRRVGLPIEFGPGPKTTAAMTKNRIPTVEKLIQAMEAGTLPVDTNVLQEIKDLREQEAGLRKEAALLEAMEQKFGNKPEYAKTLGNWARGIQKKFIHGLILHRQEDHHTKIHHIRVALGSSADEG